MNTNAPYRTTKAAQRAAMTTKPEIVTDAPGNTHRSTFTEVHVTGTTWEGHPAEMIYERYDGETIPATLADVKQIAGDFETVTRAELVTVTKTTTTTTKEIRS